MSYRRCASYRFGASKETGGGNVPLIIVNGLDTITVTSSAVAQWAPHSAANNAAGLRLGRNVFREKQSFASNCMAAAKAFNTNAVEEPRLAGEKSPGQCRIYSIFGGVRLGSPFEGAVSATSGFARARARVRRVGETP